MAQLVSDAPKRTKPNWGAVPPGSTVRSCLALAPAGLGSGLQRRWVAAPVVPGHRHQPASDAVLAARLFSHPPPSAFLSFATSTKRRQRHQKPLSTHLLPNRAIASNISWAIGFCIFSSFAPAAVIFFISLRPGASPHPRPGSWLLCRPSPTVPTLFNLASLVQHCDSTVAATKLSSGRRLDYTFYCSNP